jgi:O-antigen ligase
MAAFILGTEFLLLIALYAIFVFTDRVPLPGLVALGLLWMVRWRVTGRLTAVTPMDVPILGILAMLLVSLYVSVDWSLSLPKVYSLILGIAIFYAVVNAICTIRRVELTVAALVLLSAAVAMLGLVGTDWVNGKLFSLPQVYEHLPRLVRGVTRSIEGGFQHNNVGGTLIFFIPVLASLLWASREFKDMRFVTNERLWGILRAWYRPILISSLVLTSFTLILTQSRGSFLGVAVGLLALVAWHDRRFLWSIPLAALGIFVMVQVWGGGNLVEFVSHIDTTGGGTLPNRMEIWQRAIYMIQDFPYTASG